MKKFIEKNMIISIFGLISIVIVISYALTYNMPDYFGIESWYSLFYNISISYIAALIFYVLQVYKPNRENSKRAQLALEPLFLDLIRFIEVTIACCRKYVSADENGNILIGWHDKDQKIIYFVPTVLESSTCEHRPAVKKSQNDLKAIDTDYKSLINQIKDRIDFRECDSDILSTLSKLEATNFFKFTFVPALVLEGTFVSYKLDTFQNGVDQFEKELDEFKKCCGITQKYAVRDAENMEIAVTEAIFHENALSAKTVDEFNEITCKEHLRQQLKPILPNEELLNIVVESVLPDFMNAAKDKS